MKNVILTIVVLIAAAFGIWFFTNQDRLTEVIIEDVQKNFGGPEEHYTIAAKYPQILKGIPKKSLETINATIATWSTDLTEKTRNDFIDLASDPIAVPEYASLSFISEYKESHDFTFAPYINVMFENYAYTGGAHGGTSLTTFVFDARSGREMTLTDIFFGEYLELLSTLSLEELKELDPKLQTYTFTDVGLDPSHENFMNWNITKEGLKIFFGDYQVGPYVAGRPEIVIGWEKLDSLLLPEFKATLTK